MSRFYIRTSAEAHIFMDQHPCACGHIAFDRQNEAMTGANLRSMLVRHLLLAKRACAGSHADPSASPAAEPRSSPLA